MLNCTPHARAASFTGFSMELLSIGAAVENMWIAATSLGLSGVFMGDIVIAEETIKRKLGISAEVIGALVLGLARRHGLRPGRRYV
jgi:nitroreductase